MHKPMLCTECETVEASTWSLRLDATPMVDPDTFRAALGRFGSGVTIVTTRCQARDYGATVSAFCSLSLHPPLILVCLDKRSRCHAAITHAGAFGVNMLGRDGEWLARRFAEKLDDKFANIEYTYGISSVPILCAASVSLECKLYERISGGDHSIFVGAVIQAAIRAPQGAVIYQSGAYHRIG